MPKLIARTQTQNIVIVSGTTARTVTYPIKLDSDFRTVRGIYINRNSGSAYLAVGVKAPSGEAIVDPVNINHLVAGSNIKISDRFYKDSPFEADGKTMNITVQNFGTLGADENFDVILLLDKNPVE